MSQENLDLARVIVQAYTDGGLDAMAPYWAEDCVLDDFAGLPDRATYRGKQGLRERYRQFVESWEDFNMEPVEFIDVGNDTVVAVIAMTGRGKGAGVPLDALAAFIWEIRDGQVIRDRAFTSRAAALKALGLAE